MDAEKLSQLALTSMNYSILIAVRIVHYNTKSRSTDLQKSIGSVCVEIVRVLRR